MQLMAATEPDPNEAISSSSSRFKEVSVKEISTTISSRCIKIDLQWCAHDKELFLFFARTTESEQDACLREDLPLGCTGYFDKGKIRIITIPEEKLAVHTTLDLGLEPFEERPSMKIESTLDSAADALYVTFWAEEDRKNRVLKSSVHDELNIVFDTVDDRICGLEIVGVKNLISFK